MYAADDADGYGSGGAGNCDCDGNLDIKWQYIRWYT